MIIQLLVTLIIVLIVFALLMYIIRLLPLEEPFARIAGLLVVFVLVLLAYLLPFAGARLP